MAPGSPGWVTAERRARKSGDGGRGASSVAGVSLTAARSGASQACRWYLVLHTVPCTPMRQGCVSSLGGDRPGLLTVGCVVSHPGSRSPSDAVTLPSLSAGYMVHLGSITCSGVEHFAMKLQCASAGLVRSQACVWRRRCVFTVRHNCLPGNHRRTTNRTPPCAQGRGSCTPASSGRWRS